MMMEGGKDKKFMGPLFPRLHVNDTERGGPRAPPRNKMALYEQLSIPIHQRSSPPNNTSTLVPLASSSQEGGHERPLFSPFSIPPPTLSHSVDKLHTRSSEGTKLNTKMMDIKLKSMNVANHYEHGSLQLQDRSSLKNCCPKVRDGDNFRMPAIVQPKNTPYSSKYPHSIDGERCTHSSPSRPSCSRVISGNSTLKTSMTTNSSSMQLRGAHDKHLKRTNTTGLTSRYHGRNRTEESLKEFEIDREMQKLVSNSSTKENIAEPLEHTHVSLNQDHQMQVGKRNILRVNRKSCSGASFRNGHGNPSEAGNGNSYYQDMENGSLEVGDVDRFDGVSETSTVDSMSGLDISPDDVVGAIGQKHFWKTRTAIVDQQRLFAVQVFELHRLIEVQKLIAGSPHILFQDNSYLSKAALKISPVEKLPSSGYAVKSLRQIKVKNDTQKPNHVLESVENAIGNHPVLSPNKDINVGLLAQCSSHKPDSGNLLPPPMSSGNKTSPWCFQPPPGNQWLVPIMSPSEGLVYKPYTGGFPTTAGFMAPIYGGWGPMTVPPVAGYNPQGAGILSGVSPVSQAYFPNNGMPVSNPINQASYFLPQQQAEQLSGGDANYNRNSRSQHNMLNQKTEVISCAQKTVPSQEKAVRCSSEKEQGEDEGPIPEEQDTLMLFPVAAPVPTMFSNRPSQTETNNCHASVIKVVPHNPRTATESAARIFQSIQEERRRYI